MTDPRIVAQAGSARQEDEAFATKQLHN